MMAFGGTARKWRRQNDMRTQSQPVGSNGRNYIQPLHAYYRRTDEQGNGVFYITEAWLEEFLHQICSASPLIYSENIGTERDSLLRGFCAAKVLTAQGATSISGMESLSQLLFTAQ